MQSDSATEKKIKSSNHKRQKHVIEQPYDRIVIK